VTGSGKKLPTYFLPHGGGPCFFMEWDPPGTWNNMEEWLRDMGSRVKPKAIVVISGHWEEDAFCLTSNPHPQLIYDYQGFPPETYEIKYDAPGSPALAAEIQGLLKIAGLPARLDAKRGWDHGVFIPFKVIYPHADIPIVQMSLHETLDPELHIRAGAALESLRAQNVLIAGSGMSYHNLRKFIRGGGETIRASDQFDKWLTEAVTQPDAKKRSERLCKWDTAPSAHDAHPREEHLIPLMVAAGAAGADPGKKVYEDRVMGAALSAYKFG
jgi:aromatic ring-opening dioxygenase catalytic subunit (LigB family)